MIGEGVFFKIAAMEGRLARLDTGTGVATIQAYGGTRPPTGATLGTTLLGTVPLTKPSGTINPTTGAMTLTQEEDGLILVSGVVTWCRVVSANGDFCFDIDAAKIGTPEAATAEAVFADTQLYAGGALRLISCVLS